MQARTRARFGAWSLAGAVACAPAEPDHETLTLDGIDVGAPPQDADPEGGDDGSEPEEPDAPASEEPSGPTPEDDLAGVDCARAGCPEDRPFCVDSGACLECRSFADCSLATCEAGRCEPLPVEGVATWLRVESLPPGALSEWPATDGGFGASQSDPQRRPVVVADAIAGRPGVVFDGVDDQLVLDDAGQLAATVERTFVVVLQSHAGAGHVVGAADTATDDALSLDEDRPRWQAALGPEQRMLETPRIISVRTDGLGVAMRIDGELVAAATASPPVGGLVRTTLGAADGSAAGAALDPFAGAIAELVVYTRALSDEELARIEGWLALAHALPEADPWATLAADARIFYALDEDGPGARVDAVGGLDLAPFPSAEGTTAVPGIVGQAQHVDGAYGEYHFFRNGGGAALDHGAGSFTWAGWVAIDAPDPASPYLVAQTLVGKWDPPTSCQFRVWYEPSTRRWSVATSPTGDLADAVTLTHPLEVPSGAWALVQAWRDAARGELGLRVSTHDQLEDAVTLPLSDAPPAMANDLNVAAHATCSDGFLQGTIDALGQWRRVLTDAEAAVLHEGFEP